MQGMGSIVQMRAVASCMFSSGAAKVMCISKQHIGGLGEWFPLRTFSNYIERLFMKLVKKL